MQRRERIDKGMPVASPGAIYRKRTESRQGVRAAWLGTDEITDSNIPAKWNSTCDSSYSQGFGGLDF